LFLFNPAARFIWEGLRDGFSVEETARELSDAAGISELAARRDTERAIAAWRSEGLVGEVRARMSGEFVNSKASISVNNHSSAAATHVYRFLGRIFSIEYGDTKLEQMVHPRFENLEVGDLSKSHFKIELFRDAESVVFRHSGKTERWVSIAQAGYRLFFEVTELGHEQLQLAAWLHGGVMSRDGGSVLLIGKERSGKSTLNAGLSSEGFVCFGDDRALFERSTMRVAATPNSIGLKSGSWPVLRNRFPRLELQPICHGADHEVRYLPSPPPEKKFAPSPRAVIFPKYDPSAPTTLIPLSATDALRRMIDANAWVSPDAGDVGDFLRWAESVKSYALPFSSLDRAVDLIRELIPP
jgi:hypothetical protein